MWLCVAYPVHICSQVVVDGQGRVISVRENARCQVSNQLQHSKYVQDGQRGADAAVASCWVLGMNMCCHMQAQTAALAAQFQ